MSLFYFVVASFPLALYFLTLAWIHGCSAPCVVSGRRDFIALCLALSGIFFIGPGQLLVTWGASAVWGKYVWALLATLCLLVVVLIGSNLRPRLIVYNANRETLRKTLTTTSTELDDEARWSGAALNMPSLGVQFYLDMGGIGRVATLTQIGATRSPDAWTRFERALSAALRKTEASRGGFVCAFFGAIGIALLTADVVCVIKYQDALREAVRFYLSV